MSSDDTLYTRLADSLARSIRAGALRRGERLPSVRSLARDRQVSMATATQAYRRLEDARLVEARPRSGYFVAARLSDLPEPAASRPDARAVPVDRSSLAAELLRLAEDPHVVSFGAACPAGDLFDADRLRRAVTRAAQRHRHSLTHYAQAPGLEELRRGLARRALHMGCDLDPRQILITNGCLEAVALCLRAVTQPGDTVALESPTYFGFLEILEQLGLKALEVPTHPRTGLVVDELAALLQRQTVKALVCTPTLSNPVGACMPLAERKRLAELAAQHQLPVIEDAIYVDLAEQDDHRRAVRSFDTAGNVMLCSSITKTLAPGLRMGWVDAGRWAAKVRRIKAVTSGGQSTVLEHALADLLAQPGVEAHHRQLRLRVGQRVAEARALIAEHFPAGTRVTDPAGGFILWVELPEGADSMALFEACRAEQIVVAPGRLFSPGDLLRRHLRLGVGGRWEARERAAFVRIGALAAEQIERRSGARRTPAFDLGELP
jgi:DNA-binding transcriptional MocR family regulator